MLASEIGENRGSPSDNRENLVSGFHKCYMKMALFKGRSVLDTQDFLESYFFSRITVI